MRTLGLFKGLLATTAMVAAGTGCSTGDSGTASRDNRGSVSRNDGSAQTSSGRSDRVTDRTRVANGQSQSTLAFPTGDRATSIVLLEATGPEQVRLGQPYNYNLRVTNLTDAPLNDVRVERLTPTIGNETMGTTATRPTTRPGAAAGNMAGETARTGPGEARPAAAQATCARPAQDSASVNILTIPALQLECVDGQDPVNVGQNTTYTVTVRNEGSGADNNITLKGVLPPELQFVRGGGATNVTAEGQNLTFGPVPTLANNATATWTIEVKALRAADARFYVEMTSASLSRPAAETEPTRISTGDASRDTQQGAPVVPQGGAGPAPAGERPEGQQNNKQ